MQEVLAERSVEGSNRRWNRGAVAAIGAIPVGLMISGVLVWQSSYAAFTAVASGGSNSWSAGTVSLSGDDGSASTGAGVASALFSPTNLKPGSTGVKCVAVTYGGSLASNVRVYVEPLSAASADLAAQLDIKIEEGAGGTFSNCSGFVADATPALTTTLANLAATKTDFATGYGAWAPGAAAATKTYRFTYTLKSTAPNSVQGKSASATVVWEAQNS